MGDGMDILKTAIDWTKAEMFSSAFFILFGVVFLVASFGFWQLGKTDMSRAYVIPTLVAGALLLIIGVVIFLPSMSRVTSFETAFNNDAAAFIQTEIARADRVLNEYRIAVYMVIPLIVVVSALLLIFLQGPIWRASLVTVIAMMGVIFMIDTNANARLEIYRGQLSEAGDAL